MIWENGIETCIISYKKRITSPGSMQDTGCLGLVFWDNPEGWGGDGGGRGVQDGETHTHPWLIHVNVKRKPPQYCEVISFKLRKIFLKIQTFN